MIARVGLFLALAVGACNHVTASPANAATPHPTLERAMVLSTAINIVETASFLSSAHGLVMGRVVFDGTPPPVIRRPVHVDEAMCGSDPRDDRSLVIDPATKGVRFAVVTLTPRGPIPPRRSAPPTPSIEQAKCEFYPYVTLVRPGASVDVVNSDPGLHDLHRLEPAGPGSHDSSPPGSRVPLTFHREGRTRLVCDLHYWSSAWVIATEAPFAAVTNAQGEFSFPDVPIGEWTLGVWHERLGERELPVTVNANATSKSLVALPLPRPVASPAPAAR